MSSTVIQPEPPADGLASDDARPIWLAGDPTQPASLQPAQDWNERSWDMDEHVAVTALRVAVFMSPEPSRGASMT